MPKFFLSTDKTDWKRKRDTCGRRLQHLSIWPYYFLPLGLLLSLPLWTSYLLQPDTFLCLQHILKENHKMKSVIVVMSVPYMRGSLCSIIYRWHTTSQEPNSTWVTAEVPDEHMVLHMQFMSFLLRQMPFCEKDFIFELSWYCDGLSIFK